MSRNQIHSSSFNPTDAFFPQLDYAPLISQDIKLGKSYLLLILQKYFVYRYFDNFSILNVFANVFAAVFVIYQNRVLLVKIGF